MATKSIYSKIVGHQGPLKPNDPAYLGSSYNVMPLWDDGTTTWEPLNSMLQYDLITMVAYAKENGLLDTPGWKKCKKIARRAKVLRRMVNVTKRSSKFHEISYKFGVRLPRNYDEALRLDAQNGDTQWFDAIGRERGQVYEYKCFHSIGGKEATVPPGYKQIKLRWVFDVKPNLH